MASDPSGPSEPAFSRQVVMAPAVLTELLSDPELPSSAAHTLSDLPLIDIRPGYWHRAGRSAQVLAKKRKARLGDALIAQSCIDGGSTAYHQGP